MPTTRDDKWNRAVQAGSCCRSASSLREHQFALQRNIRRYTTGLDKDGFNLNLDVEWWVSSPTSPMALWIGGSIGFALFASAILLVGRARQA